MKYCLILIFCFFQLCTKKIHPVQADCSNKDNVLKEIHKIVQKRIGEESISQFVVEVEEDKSFFIVTYTNKDSLSDVRKKGGEGMLLKISKRNCEIVEYLKFK